jgi:hypothetical protein
MPILTWLCSFSLKSPLMWTNRLQIVCATCLFWQDAPSVVLLLAPSGKSLRAKAAVLSPGQSIPNPKIRSKNRSWNCLQILSISHFEDDLWEFYTSHNAFVESSALSQRPLLKLWKKRSWVLNRFYFWISRPLCSSVSLVSKSKTEQTQNCTCNLGDIKGIDDFFRVRL